MEKVKITQEQADLIKELLVDEWDKQEIIRCAVMRNFGISKFDPLSNMQVTVLASALLNSFEVEETPEDKVKAQYESPRHFFNKNDDTYTDVYRKGIKFALDTFNHKIEGIN